MHNKIFNKPSDDFDHDVLMKKAKTKNLTMHINNLNTAELSAASCYETNTDTLSLNGASIDTYVRVSLLHQEYSSGFELNSSSPFFN